MKKILVCKTTKELPDPVGDTAIGKCCTCSTELVIAKKTVYLNLPLYCFSCARKELEEVAEKGELVLTAPARLEHILRQHELN